MSSYLSASANYNRNQHDSMTSSLLVCNLVSMGIVAVVTVARLYVRFARDAIGWDDYLSIAAGAFALLFSGSCIYGTQQGLGKHIWDLDPQSLASGSSSSLHLSIPLYICYISYLATAGFIKCSILASYYRIFPGLTFHRVIKALVILVVMSAVSSIFVIILACLPAQSAWDWSVPRKYCIDFRQYFVGSSIISTILDIVIWSCPLPSFLRLQMDKPRKIKLLLLFGVGAFAWIAAIVRIPQLDGLQSIDITYSGVLSFNWSLAEITIAIACASTPALKPLAAGLVPRSWRSVSSIIHAPPKVQQLDKASETSSGGSPYRYLGEDVELQALGGWQSRFDDTSLCSATPKRGLPKAVPAEL